MKVIIKGVHQMNGRKPFVREISCSASEAGYYSQLMTNKAKQSQWISANFPGAQIGRGFSMTVNIKRISWDFGLRPQHCVEDVSLKDLADHRKVSTMLAEGGEWDI